ncbi:hypothetical protein [Cetobacterium sp.]|uniref:hypothetical protein n=1 Tax=Cetobacterium sp. TaxID=2071632 RepID=UPI003F41B43C
MKVDDLIIGLKLIKESKGNVDVCLEMRSEGIGELVGVAITNFQHNKDNYFCLLTSKSEDELQKINKVKTTYKK